MSKSKFAAIAVIAVVALVGTAFLSTALLRAWRFVNPYLDRDVSGARVITPQWTEIDIINPLKVERQIQNIVIEVDPTIKSSLPASMGLLLPDGKVVVPQIQLVDLDGKVYDLSLTHQSGPLSFESPSKAPWPTGFSTTQPLPRDKVFKAVRIRSDLTFRCARIYWRCYDPWDVK